MGQCGRRMLFKSLDVLYRKYEFDAIIVNGENAAHGKGISVSICNDFFSMGINGITMGNHVWNNSEIYKIIDSGENIIRPANLSRLCPGRGSMVIEAANKKIGVLNLLGRVGMQPPCDCPFEAADREIKKLKQQTDIIIVDFHAEVTSEKVAMGYFLDGRASGSRHAYSYPDRRRKNSSEKMRLHNRCRHDRGIHVRSRHGQRYYNKTLYNRSAAAL